MFISPPIAVLSHERLEGSMRSLIANSYFNVLESFSALEIYAFAPLVSFDTRRLCLLQESIWHHRTH